MEALLREAEHAQSLTDFLNKSNIALKEANESEYWLQLLKDSDYISQEQFDEYYPLCDEIIRMLVSSVRTLKAKLNR